MAHGILASATAQGGTGRIGHAGGLVDEAWYRSSHPELQNLAEDAARPCRGSYGLDLRPAGRPRIGGWIVFRNDEASHLDLSVGGAPLPAAVGFDTGAAYRDWNARQTAVPDLSGLAPGRHRPDVAVRSAGGRSHGISILLVIR